MFRVLTTDDCMHLINAFEFKIQWENPETINIIFKGKVNGKETITAVFDSKYVKGFYMLL